MKYDKWLELLARTVLWTLGIGWGCVSGLLVTRIFVCDQFIVPSESMVPTLLPGDRILVNKFIAGARLYRRIEFGEGIPITSIRTPGLRRVHPNDIVVFNAPHGYEHGHIEFRINYVFAKRCIGTPGDTICIVNSRFRNNRHNGPLGDSMQQRRLAMRPDSLFAADVLRAYPFDDALFGWTIKNMGPLHIPASGDTVQLDERNSKLYRPVIEYETGRHFDFADGRAMLDGIPIERYIFRKNYYFFCGDNVIDSKDCRYLGFVPEEFIVGVVRRITYSRDRYTGEFRRDRLWKNAQKQHSAN